MTLLLMALKVKYPKKTFMLRGNHEPRQMTQLMNFYMEAKEKYDQDVYFDIMDAFDALPLATVVNENYFCVHGGITKEGEHVDEGAREESKLAVAAGRFSGFFIVPIDREYGEAEAVAVALA